MNFYTIIRIYTRLFSQFFLLINNLINRKNSQNSLSFFIKAFIEWQVKLYLTNLFMVVYFFNNSILGKCIFFLGCFFCSALGPGEEQIFRFGFVIVTVFISANFLLYFLVQTFFVQKLLLDSIGEKIFKEFIGFNFCTKSLANFLAVGKFGAGLLLTLEVYSSGAHWVDSHQAHIQYVDILKEIDIKQTSENVKLELAQKYTDHMRVNAPHRSPVQQILGEKNIKTLGTILSDFKVFTSTK